MRPSALFWTIVAGLVGAATTLLTIFLPFVDLAYFAPTGRAIIETITVLCAAIAALLVFGRFRQDRLFNDIVLVIGLLVLALDEPIFAILERFASAPGAGVLSTWAPLTSSVIGRPCSWWPPLLPRDG